MTLERLTYLRDYFSVFRELPHGAMEEVFEALGEELNSKTVVFTPIGAEPKKIKAE